MITEENFKEMVKLIVLGYTDERMAKKLELSIDGLKSRKRVLRQKLKARNNIEIILKSVANNWIPCPHIIKNKDTIKEVKRNLELIRLKSNPLDPQIQLLTLTISLVEDILQS